MLAGATLTMPIPVLADTPVQVARLVADDQAAEDWFGYSVAISGDTAVVGAYGDDDAGIDSGSAYIFVRTGSGWTQQAKLVPSDPQAYLQFGYSVAIDGDTVVVGAMRSIQGPPYPSDYSQHVYVFVRSGGGWNQQARLGSGITSYVDSFGSSVAIDGDTIVVGAFNDRTNGVESGAAYIFVRGGTNWSLQRKLTAIDGSIADRFGRSVAIDGDTALIGAHMDDDQGEDSGSAIVFTRSAGLWTQQAKLTAGDGATYDYFGEAVALSGDTALIRARLDDDGGDRSGSAYFFERRGAAWGQTAKITASDAGVGQQFGISVAIDGQQAATGAIGPGHVYLFERSGATWNQAARVVASTGGFGVSVSVDSAILLAGGYADSAVMTRAGAAFVFQLPEVDADHDGILDGLDNCPFIANPEQTDTDLDGLGDACDVDDDNDDVLDGSDNCRLVPNASQANVDGDAFGDACDGDIDGDEFENASDNCPVAANPDQTDTDHDRAGDECDSNDDNDAQPDVSDNCPAVPNDDQADLDVDGIGDVCDADLDGDGVKNGEDNCAVDSNPSQDDTDSDGEGDVCDLDDDADGIADGSDNCSLTPNVGQLDNDGDGAGDACDGDLDGDTVANVVDNCPSVDNSGQADLDADGVGDACDDDIDGDGVANATDDCASTPAGNTIDGDGCTVDQLCPCDGPSGTVMPWRNHGKFVSCVAQTANRFLAQGIISSAEHGDLVAAAAQSACGSSR